MQFEPTLSPRFVSYIRDYLMDNEIDPEAILTECGVSASPEQEYDPPLPISTIARLFELAAERTQNHHIGLQLAQRYHYESAGLIILAVLAAPTVEVGIKTLCQYDKHMDTAIETDFKIGAGESTFSFKLINPRQVDIRHLDEFLIAFFLNILHKGTRKKIPTNKVWLAHNPLPDTHSVEKHFGSPVEFSKSINKVFFDSSFLGERFLTSSNLLFEVLTDAITTYFPSYNKGNGLIATVSQEIIRQTKDQSPTIEDIAAYLAISGRTLRRRLAKEGVSFQEMKNMARKDNAKFLLANTSLSLAEIGYRLGYSELSAFSRAFRSWTKINPQNYRDKIGKIHSF